MNQGNSERARTAASKSRRSILSGLEQRVLARLRALELPGGAAIVIGFSGGPDSLCLAAVLARVRRRAAIEPHLVHVNHRLRIVSDDAARQAESLADDIGLPIEVVKLPAEPQILHPGLGIEEAARRERYLALANVARRHDTDVVATGHHQSDQAETVLLHLLRGSGLDGASGMGDVSELTVPWWQSAAAPATIRIWRPLLDETKSTIDTYVAGLDLSPILDESNEARDFRRNAIRHDILPAIERVFPAAKPALTRYARIARDEDELLSQLAERSYHDALRSDGSIEVTRLLDLPVALKRRVLLHWLRARTRTPEIPFERVQAVLDLAEARREGPLIEVAAGFLATVMGGELVAGTRDELQESAWSRFPGPRVGSVAPLPTTLEPDRALRLERVIFETRTIDPETEGSRQSTIIPTKSGAIRVRRLRAEDRWAATSRRVDDALRRERVPVLIRDQIICVANEIGVLWIPGLRTDNESWDDVDSSLALRWRYED